MTIVARTIKGSEFLYGIKSAHKVPKNSAKTILEILNENHFRCMDGSDEVWHIYEVDEYDSAYGYAEEQSFVIRKGIVSERSRYWFDREDYRLHRKH